jgi:hypothetical protein
MEITPELAELLGVYVGDGSMSSSGNGVQITIAAGREEKAWIEHIVTIFEKAFQYRPKFHWSVDVYKVTTRINKICGFFREMGFPVGRKAPTVRVPTAIMETNDMAIRKAFLRGYFDADGCVSFEKGPHVENSKFKRTHHYYPRIAMASVSRDLIYLDIRFLLESIDFSCRIHEDKPRGKIKRATYVLVLKGSQQFERWMVEIGSSNPVHLTKYKVWKKFEFCPTKTTLAQRVAMLSSELDPEFFYENGE